VIPVAAGLGGGSSDAGAVLRGLNHLFAGSIANDRLLQLACSLGADVPFFTVDHRAAIARGIGEILFPIASLEDCSFILVNPDLFVSTAWVFQNLPLTTEPKPSKLSCFQRYGSVSSLLSEMHNDLETVTTVKYPEIDDIKELLLRLGASRVLMSGSGPTVFGVFPDSDVKRDTDLRSVVEALRRQGKERTYLLRAFAGASPSGKAPGFDPGIRRFESFRPSHC
jgi:4-diphosphocytidyl-2-C-methyl-D-erythritol kinase